jgi:hypothetical protein
MNVRLTLVALATLIGLSGAAHADIFGAGPVYGGPGSVNGRINCRIFNFGSYPVTIPLVQIWTNTNVLVTPASNTCTTSSTNPALAPGRYCAVTALITGNLAYSCRVVASGFETRLSGAAEIQAPNFSVLNVLPLQK